MTLLAPAAGSIRLQRRQYQSRRSVCLSSYGKLAGRRPFAKHGWSHGGEVTGQQQPPTIHDGTHLVHPSLYLSNQAAQLGGHRLHCPLPLRPLCAGPIWVRHPDPTLETAALARGHSPRRRPEHCEDVRLQNKPDTCNKNTSVREQMCFISTSDAYTPIPALRRSPGSSSGKSWTPTRTSSMNLTTATSTFPGRTITQRMNGRSGRRGALSFALQAEPVEQSDKRRAYHGDRRLRATCSQKEC